MSTSKVIAVTMTIISLVLMIVVFQKSNEIEYYQSQEHIEKVIVEYHHRTNLYMVANSNDTIYLNEIDKYEALRKGEAILNKTGEENLFIRELE